MSFRTNLQYLRAERHMTQEQLAMLLGVSRQSVTKWEAEKSYPEMDKLIKMCQIFECSLDDLVQGDLTDRAPAPAVATVPPGPATDVCGYDDHMRSFAKRVPTGVAAFILGVVGLVLFEEGTALRGLFNSSMAASWASFWAGRPVLRRACGHWHLGFCWHGALCFCEGASLYRGFLY